MATQTEHLGLHQWEPEDSFLREDFNQDFAKIDAGVGAASRLPYVVGTVQVTAAAQKLVVELGFTPSAVIVGGKMGIHSCSGGGTSRYHHNSQGFALKNTPSYTADMSNYPSQVAVEIVEGGFTIQYMDISANPFRYIAFR